MSDLLFLIPALPALGFVVLVVFGKRLGEPLAGWLATTMVGGSFLLSAATFVDLLSKEAEERRLTQTLFTWVPVGNFKVLKIVVIPVKITVSGKKGECIIRILHMIAHSCGDIGNFGVSQRHDLASIPFASETAGQVFQKIGIVIGRSCQRSATGVIAINYQGSSFHLSYFK